MLQPARTAYRKMHRNRGKVRRRKRATKGFSLAFGAFGLKSIDGGELSSRQIEAARRAMTRSVQRGGKIWIRVFPQKAITRKSPEVPMGAGKGAVEFYAAEVSPGTMIFEIDGLPEAAAREALRLASHKLPVRTKFVSRIHL